MFPEKNVGIDCLSCLLAEGVWSRIATKLVSILNHAVERPFLNFARFLSQKLHEFRFY